MKHNFASGHVRTALAAFIAIFAISSLGYVMYEHIFAPQLAQRQQRNASYTKLFGPGGRDVRKAGQMIDMMHKSVSDRMVEVATLCIDRHLSDKTRARLVEQTFSTGEDAIHKVVVSRYTVPFEPHYPPLPQ